MRATFTHISKEVLQFFYMLVKYLIWMIDSYQLVHIQTIVTSGWMQLHSVLNLFFSSKQVLWLTRILRSSARTDGSWSHKTKQQNSLGSWDIFLTFLL